MQTGAAPSPTGPLSFMYRDFKNLQVTVSQTQDITHQGVTVTWTGGEQTIDERRAVQGNFLQLMECYGDAGTGPIPQGCEFGSRACSGTDPNQTVGDPKRRSVRGRRGSQR